MFSALEGFGGNGGSGHQYLACLFLSAQKCAHPLSTTTPNTMCPENIETREQHCLYIAALPFPTMAADFILPRTTPVHQTLLNTSLLLLLLLPLQYAPLVNHHYAPCHCTDACLSTHHHYTNAHFCFLCNCSDMPLHIQPNQKVGKSSGYSKLKINP